MLEIKKKTFGADPFQDNLGSYAAVKTADFLTFRLKHFVTYYLNPKTKVRPNVLYNGEIEGMILNPLHEMATQLISGEVGAGFVSRRFMNLAHQFALLAELLDQAGIKPVLDTLSIKLLESSPLMRGLQNAGVNFPEEDRESNKHARWLVSSVFASAPGAPNPSGSDPSAVLDEIRKMAGPAGADATPESMDRLFKEFTNFTGMSYGPPLPSKQAEVMRRKFATIEYAIQCGLDGSLCAKPPSSPSEYADDAYALAWAYYTYLHHTETLEKYEMFAPKSHVAAQTLSKVAVLRSSAIKIAWFYSSFQDATFKAGLTLTYDTFKAGLDLLEKSVEFKSSSWVDLNKMLELFNSQISDPSIAPIVSHARQVLNYLAAPTAADHIIPGWMYEKLRAGDIEVPSDVTVPPGSPPPMHQSAAVSFIDEKTFDELVVTFTAYITTARELSSLLSFTTSGYLNDLLSDKTQEVIIPSLESAPPVVDRLTAFKYRSIVDDGCLDLAIPRFTFDNKGRRSWTLGEYTYGVSRLGPLLRAVIPTKPRNVFPPHPTLPISHLIGSSVGVLPIPECYVRENYAAVIPNTIDSIYASRRGIPGIMGHPEGFFDDIALMLSSKELSQNGSILDALAAICRVFKSDKEGKIGNLVVPNIPAIYGAPTQVFLSKQPSVSQLLSKGDPKTYARASANGDYYTFVLHTAFPPPSEVISIPWTAGNGAHLMIPLQKEYVAGLKDAVENLADHNLGGLVDDKKFETILPHVSLIEAGAYDDDNRDWMESDGWTSFSRAYPHVTFSSLAAPAVTMGLVNDELLAYLFSSTHIAKGPGRTFKAKTEYSDPTFVLEYDDQLTIFEAEEKTPQQVDTDLPSETNKAEERKSSGPQAPAPPPVKEKQVETTPDVNTAPGSPVAGSSNPDVIIENAKKEDIPGLGSPSPSTLEVKESVDSPKKDSKPKDDSEEKSAKKDDSQDNEGEGAAESPKEEKTEDEIRSEAPNDAIAYFKTPDGKIVYVIPKEGESNDDAIARVADDHGIKDLSQVIKL